MLGAERSQIYGPDTAGPIRSQAEAATAAQGPAPDALRALQRGLGNAYLQQAGAAPERQAASQPFKIFGSAGGLSSLTLDVTFTVSDTPAKGLQVIQTFWGTRRTDGKQVGTMTFTENKKTYDAFVDGGDNSPYVTMGGNPPAHPTLPYYLTADEVKDQVKFTKDAGTIRVFDAPGAVAAHDEAYFETAIIAIDHKGSGKDKVLTAFDWGFTAKGTKPTVTKGTEIDKKDSGINVKSSVSSRFTSIVKHDYPKYSFT